MKLNVFTIFQRAGNITAGVFITISLLFMQDAVSQVSGDFRSNSTGDWETIATWQTYNGSSWVSATTLPGNTTITVQAGHTISITSNFVSPSLGTINVNGILNLVGGSNPKSITLNTNLINISGASSQLNFNTQKVDLYLPANAVLQISNGGDITGACSNNTEIFIGGQLIGVCAGGGGSGVLTFSQIVAGGGTLNANITTPASSPSSSCTGQPINLLGKFEGSLTNVTYTWSALDPSNNTVAISSNVGTLVNSSSTTGATSFTPTINGTYLVTLSVTNATNTLTNVETKTVIVSTCLDFPVETDNDDAEENISGGGMDLTSSDLELYRDGADDQLIGIRFQNVTVPAGATITNAYIQFEVDETNSTAVTLNIVGIAVDDAVQFASTPYNISDRIDGDISSGTFATVAGWSPPSWPTSGVQGVDQRTPDLKAIVQEIIDIGGWNSSNAMAFVITGTGAGTRIAESYNGTQAPILHLEFTTPVGPEIDILGNGNSIVSGDTTPSYYEDTKFLSPAISAPETHTFTIDNTAGTEVLTISSITSDNTEFTLASIPASVDVGATATFDVIYTPTALGSNTATITINNNDSSPSESAYTFQVEGAVIVSTVSTIGPSGEWNYLDDGSNQGTAWQTIDFDDSSWASGNATLGYGPDAYIDTNIGQPAAPRPITTYFRKTFIADATNVGFSIMDLSAIRDDGMVVYLNGIEIWRDNMSGTITYDKTADGVVGGTTDPYLEGEWIYNSLSNAVVLGVNVIAVEIHQDNDGSSDIGFNFDLDLSGGFAPEIDILGNGLSIIDEDTTPNNADHTYFESTAISTTITKTYTIVNDGSVDLDVSNIVSNNLTEFSITAPAFPFTIASGGGSTTFTVTYNATTEGRSIGTITVTNTDGDEGSYNFNVLGEISTAYNFNSGGHWLYLDNGSDEGKGWQDVAYDDSTWESGDAEFGYGDDDEETVVSYGSDDNNKHRTTYFRKSINITAAELAYASLKLNAIRDDGMVVYINGNEVWRDHITGAVVFNTLADSPSIIGADETTWITSTITNPFTVAGVYEIAVEIHQQADDSSDISFDFSLQLSNNLLNADGEWHYLDDGSNQGTAWQTDTALFSTWASGNAELGFGDGGETTVVTNNSQITTYFRKSITASGADVTNSTLQISAVRDDGIVIYINGVEVLRNNMPTGPINYNTTAFGNVSNDAADRDFESWWNIFTVANPLTAGVNEIAVEIHQYTSTSSDISFNLEFETNNDFSIIPSVKPDNDKDGREDYVDADDDNDGLPDLIEGCFTTNPESLSTGQIIDNRLENSILSSLPKSTNLNDGNVITYSVNNESNFGNITSYDALEHGFAVRVRGPATNAELTFEFDVAVDNLFFKLVDFDEDETFKIDVYDDLGNIVDLGTEEGLYHLGSFIEYLGSNTITDKYSTGAPNANNPDNRADDIYGAAYFYFPNISVKKIVFTINYSEEGTIRIAGLQYCTKDTDSDGIDDFYDSDSDNDGIPDLVEAGGVDINGDGVVDQAIDTDGDGVYNIYDTDPNTYFIEEPSLLSDLDFDGDGVPNRLDLDSDNDGIVDLREIELPDIDFNGQIDGFTDSNNDGYHDSFDGGGSQLITGADTNTDGFPNSYPNKNVDLTGFPNYLDVDADGDGITDHTEAQQTTATIIGYSYNANEGDGLLTVFDNNVGNFGGNGLIPTDSDGDGIPDFLDDDSDDDGELDSIEGHDTNGDGIINQSDDSCLRTGLYANTGMPNNADTDGDGLDDGYDNDLVTYEPSNSGIQPNNHPNIDDIATLEKDWREPLQLYDVIDFDGQNDYIDFADSHNLTSSFTFEAWVKQNPASTGDGIIIGKRDCNKGVDSGYNLKLENHFPNITWYNSSGAAVLNLTSTHPISTDRWYQLAVVYDNTSEEVKIYIDGIQTAIQTGVSTGPLDSYESFLIGAKFDDTENTFKLSDKFHGWIDEVRIWNTALTVPQLRMMMNQEIEQNGTAVRGKTVPINIPGLNWSNDLLGYYPMNEIVDGHLIDQSGLSKNGRMRNILTDELQTAPLPYTSRVDDQDWDNPNTWTNFDVWDVPNSAGVDGTIIDWNIVQTSHNISSGNKEITVLGLISDTADKTLTIADPNQGLDELNNGQSLRVTHYLELDGIIDLVGESQLLQDPGSILDEDSGGYLERDQQGTANSFNYNYWSSSVGTITPTGIGQRGTGVANTSNSFSVKNQQFDGRDSAAPVAITDFGTSPYYADSAPAVADSLKISSYWLWKFNGLSDIYDAWVKINENTQLNAGEGYTMKGSLGNVTVTTNQNYSFRGKPNNGDIDTLKLKVGNDRLVGNPYPSALDADEFILDNIKDGSGRNTDNIFNGALYFWDHFGEENSHILREYVGGYATYTLMGGAKAYANDARINNNGTYGSKVPGRYIPVSQGFFVNAVIDTLSNSIKSPSVISGGDIVFKNSQRVFQREAIGASVFMKTSKAKKSNVHSDNQSIDPRQKIRLLLNSPKKYHRQLLIGVDENASNYFDIGYDGPMADVNAEDMFWIIDEGKFVIQGVNNFNRKQEFPLGLIISESGLVSIEIDELENMDNTMELYIKDNLISETYKINNYPFEINLEPGEYLNRFSLVFQPRLRTLQETTLIEGIHTRMNNSISELEIRKIVDTKIESVNLYNYLGQLINTWENNLDERFISLPIKTATGAYIVQINTIDGQISKKIIIE